MTPKTAGLLTTVFFNENCAILLEFSLKKYCLSGFLSPLKHAQN